VKRGGGILSDLTPWEKKKEKANIGSFQSIEKGKVVEKVARCLDGTTKLGKREKVK